MGFYECICLDMPDFWDWVEEKMSRGEFLGLKSENKREVFLQYKWGSKNNESNDDLEMTERDTVQQLRMMKEKDWEIMEETSRNFFLRKLKWNNYCNSILREIFGDVNKAEDLNKQYGRNKVNGIVNNIFGKESSKEVHSTYQKYI